MNAANVPKSRMGAASWAACQKIPCLVSDGFELLGPEVFSLGDIKEELMMMGAEVVDVTMIALQDIVAFIGLDWSSFYRISRALHKTTPISTTRPYSSTLLR